MRIVIAGGGMVGLMLARLLRMRGFEPLVFERMKEGQFMPRGYMLGYHGYPPFEELGILHQLAIGDRETCPICNPLCRYGNRVRRAMPFIVPKDCLQFLLFFFRSEVSAFFD